MSSDRRNKLNAMAVANQEVCERAVIVVRWLECNLTSRRCCFELVGQFVKITERVCNARSSSFPVRIFNQDMMPRFGYIDRYKTVFPSGLLKDFMVASSREMCQIHLRSYGGSDPVLNIPRATEFVAEPVDQWAFWNDVKRDFATWKTYRQCVLRIF
jgi:hypothetical protein